MTIRLGIGNIDLRNVRSSFSWLAWWASRYPSALTLTVNSNVQITLNWINNGDTDYDGVSIERSTDGVTYAEIDTTAAGSVTYVSAGLTGQYYWYRIRYYRGTHYSAYSNVAYNEYPLVIYDGNTVAWYKYDDLTTITKDGANRVSVWADRLGSGHDLLQATAANQPLWSAANGLLFDGANDFLKTLPFVLIQPEFIYFVGRQITWTLNDVFFDGNVIVTGVLGQYNLTPRLDIYAGAFPLFNNPNLVLNNFGIVRVLFNGVNSRLQINLNAVNIGNSGAANMGAFTLGSRGDGAAAWANIQAKEIIIRRSADNATVQGYIYDYLKLENGL